MASTDGVSRQRLDYIDKPDGSVDAVLTVTLPGGVVKRFVANVDPAEAQAVSGEIVAGELLLNPTVGVSFFKKIGRLAKKVAGSKVFQLAAKGLALAAPLLGPIAPAALAASAGLGVASKLAKAGVAAASGAQAVAKELTSSAARDAVKLTRTPAGAAALLKVANAKRLGAERVANSGKENEAPKPRAVKRAPARAPAVRAPAPQPRSSSPAPASAPASTNVLELARAGRVRSSDGTPVTPSQLLAANSQGRIYWVN